MRRYPTLANAINYAKHLTANAAANETFPRQGIHFQNRKFSALAKELNAGRGYIIATPAEMARKYGDLFDMSGYDRPNTRLRLFAISYNFVFRSFRFAWIR